MKTEIILIVLLSSVIHATWNYLSKTIVGNIRLYIWLVATVTSAIYLPVMLVYAYLYGIQISPLQGLFLFGTAVMHFVYFSILQKGYQVSDLSVVYPITRGTGPLLATIGAVLFFNESLTFLKIAGLGMVVLGVLMVAGLMRKNKPRNVKIGIAYGILTGCLVASYTLWDGYAVRSLMIAPMLIEYASHPFRVVVLLPKAIREWSEVVKIWEKYKAKIVAISILTPIGFLLVLYALKVAPISYVAPARELSIVIGVFLGTRVLQEEDAFFRVLGAICIVLGIVGLSM